MNLCTPFVWWFIFVLGFSSHIYICFASWGCIFFIKICCNCFCFFSVYNFITRNHSIVNNTCYIFPIFTTSWSRIPNIIFFTDVMFFALTSTFIVIPNLIWITLSTIKFTFTFAWYIFVRVFNSFFPVKMLNMLRFKSSVLFGTHN